MLDVVELIHELTDEDAGAEYEEAESEETEEAMKLLIDSLVRASVISVVHFPHVPFHRLKTLYSNSSSTTLVG